jgi:DNA/RNA-binding domain of Phe-tRNA-synthetase-like protein
MAGVEHLNERRDVALGWRAREIQEELPGLRLLVGTALFTRSESLLAASPQTVRQRLSELSNRFRGARAVSIRREPVPAAYRVFFRHIGLEPDAVRTPIEAAILDRMLHGGFQPRGLLEDVLLIGLVDTGVPVFALDADTVQGQLGIRTSRAGERLGREPDAPVLPGGRLVVADSSAAVAILFGEIASDHKPGSDTGRIVLFAVQVDGVPDLFAEEALWSCRAALEQPES